MHTVDASGKACPLPIIELAKAMRAHAEVLLIATDPAVQADCRAYCDSTGNELVSIQKVGAAFNVLVRAGRR